MSFWSDSGRLQLWWDSPIVAGAVLAALVPVGFLALIGNCPKLPYVRRGVMFVWTFAFVFACVLTQSRGPLLACAVSGVVGYFTCRRFGASWTVRLGSLWVTGLAVLLPFALGQADRISSAFNHSDDSINNRWVIWSSSLHSLFLSPISGLGTGEAGNFFSQWFQPDRLDYRYNTVFNELIQLGVEQGIISLAIFLTAAIFSACLPILINRAASAMHPLASAFALSSYLAMLVLFVCGLFSIISGSISIVLIGIANASIFFGSMVVLIGHINRVALLNLAMCSQILTLLSIGTAWVFCNLQQGQELRVTRPYPHCVRLTKLNFSRSKSRSAVIFVDRNLLGPLYGKEVRKWLLDSEGFDDFLVMDPRYPYSPRFDHRYTVILTGNTARFADRVVGENVEKLVLVHPSPRKPDVAPPSLPIVVYHPDIDEEGETSKIQGWHGVSGSLRNTGSFGNSLIGLRIKL